MMVAVASPFSPPQHCPMFGHRASSHTVCKPSPLKSFLILLYDAEVGTAVFKYPGSRGLRGRESALSALIGQGLADGTDGRLEDALLGFGKDDALGGRDGGCGGEEVVEGPGVGSERVEAWSGGCRRRCWRGRGGRGERARRGRETPLEEQKEVSLNSTMWSELCSL